MLRLALAGLGHGKSLLQANLPENEGLGIRVTAVCDTNEARLVAAASQYGIEHATADFDDLLSDDELDIVGIYTPGPLHARQVLAALDAGKHVMVTKPVAYSMEEIEHVVEAVERTGLVLLVTQSMRGRYDFIDAKRACDAGEIGDLFMAEAHYIHDMRHLYATTPWRVEMPQDLILEGACHPIDLLQWFMGDIDEVHCVGLRSGVAPDYPQEDGFFINVRFASGKVGRVANIMGLVHPLGVSRINLSVYGTGGTIRAFFGNMGRVELSTKTLEQEGLLPQRSYVSRYPSRDDHNDEMIVLLRHIAACILEGDRPWIDARQAGRVVSAGLSCWESLRTGMPVKVRNDF